MNVEKLEALEASIQDETATSVLRSDVYIDISNVELQTALPTTSEASRQLYKSIAEKKENLVKVRSQVDALERENVEKQKELEFLKRNVKVLEANYSFQEEYLKNQQQSLNNGKAELSRFTKEEASMKSKIATSKTRNEKIAEKIAKQIDLLADLDKKVKDQTKRKELIDRKTDEADFICSSIEDAYRRDQRTIKELESYLKRNFYQVYEKQKELDLLKLGQLDAKIEIEGIRRLMLQTEQRRCSISFENANKQTTETTIDGLDMNQEIEQLINEYMKRNGEEIYSLEKELDKHLETMKNENDTIKPYQSTVGEGIETLVNRETKNAKQINISQTNDTTPLDNSQREYSDGVSQELERESTVKNKTSIKSNEHKKNNYKKMEKENISHKNTTDDDPEAAMLKEINRKRDKILDECMNDVIRDMRRRCTELKTEVLLIDGQVKISCDEVETLRVSIQREVDKTNEIKERMALIHRHISQRKVENDSKYSTQRENRANEEKELQEQVAKLMESLNKIECKKNSLNVQLIQAKVDESNLRNRRDTYKSQRKSQKFDDKELERLRNLENELRKRVEKARIDVENLEAFLYLAKQRSRLTRREFFALRSASQSQPRRFT